MHLTEVETPALVVDADVLAANVARTAEDAARRGLALRPHAKTHKCLEIARLQVESGAVGLTVATLSEAQVFASAGFGDLFVAYPVHPRGTKADRLRALLDEARLTVGVDGPVGAATLARAAGGRRLRVAIEVDSGQHRTGVRPEEVVELARSCEEQGLTVVGVFTHGGHAYAGPSAPASAAVEEGAALAEASDRLADAGIPVEMVSAGSTPTSGRDRPPQVTEERPGTYVFHDRQQLALGTCTPGDLAAMVAATVVSSSADRFVLDAGSKALAGDRQPWLDGAASLPSLHDLPVTRLSEHHGVVDRRPDRPWHPPEVGEVVLVAPNHVCTVVNLFDEYAVVRDAEVVDRWRVAARGRNV